MKRSKRVTHKRTGTRGIFGKNPHYLFRDRDPIFDVMKSLWRMSGLKISKLSENTGIPESTLYSWLVIEAPRTCRHDNARIFFASFGIPYEPAMHRRSNAPNVVAFSKKKKVA